MLKVLYSNTLSFGIFILKIRFKSSKNRWFVNCIVKVTLRDIKTVNTYKKKLRKTLQIG